MAAGALDGEFSRSPKSTVLTTVDSVVDASGFDSFCVVFRRFWLPETRLGVLTLLLLAVLVDCSFVGVVVAVVVVVVVVVAVVVVRCLVTLRLAVEFCTRRGVTAPSDVDGGIVTEPVELIFRSGRLSTSVESDFVVPRSVGVGRLVRDGGTVRRFTGKSSLLATSPPFFVALFEVLVQFADSGVERRLLTGLGDFSLLP